MHSTSDICYVCGNQGPTQIAQTRPTTTTNSSATSSKVPCFPSLLLVPPAASSKPPSTIDGHVRLCGLCYRLLLEQWKSYEKRKTPLANRQYWLKCCSALRDGFDTGTTPATVANTRSTDRETTMETSRSPSSTPPAVAPSGIINAISIMDDGSKVRRGGGSISTDSKPPALSASSKLGMHSPDSAATVRGRSICVICSRGIESMDVCRRLPAHLVAQVADVKMPIGQLSASANLTGEALVCDECFASPSFQTSWLDCCRRGNVLAPTAIPNIGQQRQQSEQRPDSQVPTTGFGAQSIASGLHNQQNLTEAQRQWFAMYERALLQFHLANQLDPSMVGQMQQLAAAEALASLQHSGGGNGSNETDQSTNAA